MNYIVFDEETTGVGEKDEVVQFGCLILDENFQITRPISCYFQSHVPVNAEAAAKTHLSSEIAHELSGGMFFEDFYWESDIFKMTDVTWIGFNPDFDIRLCNQTLNQNGLSSYDFGDEVARLNKKSGVHHFDVMKACMAGMGLNYYPNLAQCGSKLSYSQSTLDGMYEKLIKIIDKLDYANKTETLSEKLIGISDNGKLASYHDALYDAMITWLLLYQNRKWCI